MEKQKQYSSSEKVKKKSAMNTTKYATALLWFCLNCNQKIGKVKKYLKINLYTLQNRKC